MKIAIIVGLVVFFAFEYYSAPKVVYIEKEAPKSKTFLVVDTNYVDHTGDYDSCVEYKEYFKDHHDYVVVEQIK